MKGVRGRGIRQRVGLLATAAVVLTALAFGMAALALLEGFLDDTLAEDFHREHLAVEARLNARADANLFLATSIAARNGVVRAMRAGDREALLALVEPPYRQLREDFSIDSMYFLSPEGVAVLRLHAPSLYGDNLAPTRPMVAEAIATRGQLRGVEWGINGLVVRGMRSVSGPDGEHLGLVEVGSFINDRLLREITPPSTSGIQLAIYARRPGGRADSGGDALPPSLVATTDPLAPQALPAADLAALDGVDRPIRRAVSRDGVPGYERVFALHDYRGQVFGLLRLWSDGSVHRALERRALGIFLAIGGIGVLLAVALGQALGRTLTNPILDLAAQITALREGRLDGQIAHTGRTDEIGAIARAMEGLRAQLLLDRRKERLLRHRDRLQAIGNMTGNVAHELNNVLQPIGIAAEILEMEPMGEAAQRRLGTIQVSLERAHQLLRRLLDFSRAEEGAAAERDAVRAVPVPALVAQCDDLLQPALGRNQVVAFGAAVPEALVRCDPAGFCQVMLNLCRNGFDAMDGAGRIEIGMAVVQVAPEDALSAVVRPGRYLRFDVRDHGPGIPEAIRDRVLEPFFTTKPQGEGTGLGLSIAYGMVAEWGGHLSFTTETGKGTTFHILLPAAEPMPCGAAPAAAAPAAHAPA